MIFIKDKLKMFVGIVICGIKKNLNLAINQISLLNNYQKKKINNTIYIFIFNLKNTYLD